MSEDTPVHALNRLHKKMVRMEGKLTHMETKMQGVVDEFTDLVDTLTNWLSYSHSNILVDHLDPDPDLTNLQIATESILEKMRKRYG